MPQKRETHPITIYSWLENIQELHPGLKDISEHPLWIRTRLISFSSYDSDVVKQLIRFRQLRFTDRLFRAGSFMTCLGKTYSKVFTDLQI